MSKLKIGDKAPEINALDEKGKAITLSEFRGKKVVLYFYPKDDTPTCTVESCNLRDNYSLLQKNGYEVIGVSADDQKKHQKFISKYSLPFTLLADEDKKVIMDYGVWGEKKFMGKVYDGIIRTTFVIDEEGKIEKIFDKVDSKRHAEQILEN